MTDHRAALREIAEALPAGSGVTVPREWLLEALDGAPGGSRASAQPVADLTVAALAEIFARRPSTVRAWLEAGLLEGYRLNGREWRVTSTAVEAFQARQRAGKGPAGQPAPDRGSQGLGDWRTVRRKNG